MSSLYTSVTYISYTKTFVPLLELVLKVIAIMSDVTFMELNVPEQQLNYPLLSYSFSEVSVN